MAANTSPIYTKTPDLSNNNGTGMNQPITTAANDFTGAGANNSLIFTSGANGSRLFSIRLKAAGTNASATVMRFFLNNSSTNATATNNSFFGEIALPATTAAAGAITSSDFEYFMGPDGISIPATWRVYAGLGTAGAGGWICIPIAGQY